MEDLRTTVALLVKRLKKRKADSEDAFHNLIEIDHGAVPFLISALQAETDDRIRAKLVEIIW